MPLLVLLRDVLKVADTAKEVQRILTNEYVKVDQKVRKNKRFPVGHQDVVELIPLKKYYRLVYFPTKGLMPVEISEEEADKKLVKIIGKSTVKGGNIQLHLHDGRNILLSEEEGRKYQTRGSLLIKLPSQEILDYYPLQEKMYSIVTAGNNMGFHGNIIEINKLFGPRASNVSISGADGQEFRTALDYVFITGKEAPALTAVPQ